MSDLSARELASGAGAATPKSAAFTPGPWSMTDGLDIINSEHGSLLTGSGYVRYEPDARLIAAAPELLEALRVAVQLADQILHGNTTPPVGAKLIADNSRAAIAKALGPAPSTSGATDASQVPGLASKPETPAPTREEGR